MTSYLIFINIIRSVAVYLKLDHPAANDFS